jgi:hypothetical protein
MAVRSISWSPDSQVCQLTLSQLIGDYKLTGSGYTPERTINVSSCTMFELDQRRVQEVEGKEQSLSYKDIRAGYLQ